MRFVVSSSYIWLMRTFAPTSDECSAWYSFWQYEALYFENTALYLNCVGKLLSVIVSSSPSSISSDIFLSRLGRSCSCRLASCIHKVLSPVRIAGFFSCLSLVSDIQYQIKCNIDLRFRSLSQSVDELLQCRVRVNLQWPCDVARATDRAVVFLLMLERVCVD
jgi:hypothetical protein